MSDSELFARGYEDRYFTVRDGLRLHYRDYPGSSDKPPLLCLHGLTRNSRDWAQFADHYSPSTAYWRLIFAVAHKANMTRFTRATRR